MKVLRPIPAVLAACLLVPASSFAQSAPVPAPASVPVDATSLRELLVRVGEHAFRPIEDGDYKLSLIHI